MNEIFEKNIKWLQEHRPSLYECLEPEIQIFKDQPNGTQNESFELVATSGQTNLIYSRLNPGCRVLYHGLDPMAEAKAGIEAYKLEHPSLLVVFGLGLGYWLKEFLSNRPHTNFSILVVEKNPQIFLRALAIQNWTVELEDESMEWIVTSDLGVVSNRLIDFFIGNTTVDRHLKIIGTPQALETEGDFYTQVGKALMDARDHSVLLVGNSVNDQFLGFNNIMDNMEMIFKNPGLARLENQFKGKLCVSVAAGPSVNEHWETLKAIQGKIPIIACDTVLKPMSDRGIYPDFITALERDDYVPRLFRNIYVNERTTLVAPMLLMKESFDCCQGEILLYTPSPLYTEALNLQFCGRFHPGSSAGNLNVALAAYMGFSTTIMIGHNLAYGFDSHETHVAGTIDPDRERSRSADELAQESKGLRVMTQDEKDSVPTRIEWNYFRKQMEQLFVTHSDRKWINTAPKGAYIKGADLMTVAEALEKYRTEDFDLYPVKRELLKPLTENEVTKRKAGAKMGFQRSLKALKKRLSEAQEISKKLKKWETKIKDKELVGKYVGFDFLNSALDEILSLKTEAVNEDRIFYMVAITILMPFHATFERLLNQMRADYKDDYLLKRDFLLKHAQYFEAWERHIPKIIERFETIEKSLDDVELTENMLNEISRELSVEMTTLSA